MASPIQLQMSSRRRLCLLIVALSLCSVTTGQLDFLSALSAQSSLSTFTSLIRQYGSLVSAAEAGNMTILAPNNAAFSTFFSASNTPSNFSSPDQLEPLLSYHFLKGVYAQAEISSTPQFIPTLLTNSSYTNITTGQVVEASLNNSAVCFGSAVNRVSKLVGPTYDVFYYGGLVHIIDSVLTPPHNVDETVTEAPLPYFIDLVSSFLTGNPDFLAVLENVTDIKDSTFFAANSPTTESNARTNTTTLQQSLQLAEYDIIPGKILYSTLLTNGSSFTTAAGVNITITIVNNETYVNNAKITWKDILVSNGVLHAIDTILDPQDPNARPSINSTLPSPKASDSSGGRSTRAKAGIGVGVALGILAIVGVLGLLIGVRRSRSASKQFPKEYQLYNGAHMALVPELDSKTYSVHELDSRHALIELDGR